MCWIPLRMHKKIWHCLLDEILYRFSSVCLHLLYCSVCVPVNLSTSHLHAYTCFFVGVYFLIYCMHKIPNSFKLKISLVTVTKSLRIWKSNTDFEKHFLFSCEFIFRNIRFSNCSAIFSHLFPKINHLLLPDQHAKIMKRVLSFSEFTNNYKLMYE